MAEAGALAEWIDGLAEAAMREPATRDRAERFVLGILAAVREDGGDLWEAWRALVREAFGDAGRGPDGGAGPRRAAAGARAGGAAPLPRR